MKSLLVTDNCTKNCIYRSIKLNTKYRDRNLFNIELINTFIIYNSYNVRTFCRLSILSDFHNTMLSISSNFTGTGFVQNKSVTFASKIFQYSPHSLSSILSPQKNEMLYDFVQLVNVSELHSKIKAFTCRVEF